MSVHGSWHRRRAEPGPLPAWSRGSRPELGDIGGIMAGQRWTDDGHLIAALSEAFREAGAVPGEFVEAAQAASRGAIAALAEALRPGATDHQVLALAEQAYVAQGGLHQIHYLGITAMDDPALGCRLSGRPDA